MYSLDKLFLIRLSFLPTVGDRETSSVRSLKDEVEVDKVAKLGEVEIFNERLLEE